MIVKYTMRYKLYTLVDITHTGQYRIDQGKDNLRWKEQNFNTVIQVIGLRANITSFNKPESIEVNGRVIGFDTDEMIRVWRFDFETEHDYLFDKDGDPVGFLKDDFHLVPYINGLDELMDQQYAVFVTHGPGKNIIFNIRK